MFIFSLIFLSGIVIVNYLAIIPSFTILCILIIILLGLIKKHKSISYFLILVCAIHLTAHELYCLKHEQWLLSHFINRSVSVKGMLISKQRDFFTLSVNTVCLKNELAKSSASCLKFKHLTMMVNVNSQQDSFNLQDEITFKTKLKRKQEFYNFTDDISMFQAGGTNANIKNIYLKEQNVIKLVKAKVNLREYLLKKYSAYISKLDNAGLMLALIFGDKDLISLEQKNIFQNTGTGHLLAISGMHLSFIYFLILKILKRLRLLNCNNSNFNRLHVSYVLAWFVTAFYGYIAGFSIATQRAFIAISFFLLCKLFHFNMFSFDVWSCCLVLVLLYDVNAINGMGFWLSFIATFGLLYTHTSRFVFWQKKTFYPPKWNKMAFDNIMLSCKTFIILLPISILFFNKISLGSIMANIVAIPIMSAVVLPVLFLSLFMMLFNINNIITILIEKILVATNWLLTCLNHYLQYISEFDINIIYLYFDNLSIGLIVIIILILSLPSGLPKFQVYCIVNLLLISNLFAQYKSINKGLNIDLLDVGQGLAVLINTPNHQLLYDTGAKINGNYIAEKVILNSMRRYYKTSDYIVISHWDDDHSGNLGHILRYIHPIKLISSDLDKNTSYLDKINNTHKKKPSSELCNHNMSWTWDNVYFEFFKINDDEKTSKNNNSCILRIKYNDYSVLLTGDIESAAELKLINQYKQLDANILLVPHHGSKTSSNINFIKQIAPKYALISVGNDNIYKHPHQIVLEKYKDLNIEVFRTDIHGAININIQNDIKIVKKVRNPYA